MNSSLFETKYWKIILSDNQAYFGRLVIVLLSDKTALGDISQEEQLDFFNIVKHLEDFYRREFNATMFNYSCLMNDAYRDGERPRVHWHLRPRYKEPIVVLGEKFSDPNFGHHYLSEAFGVKRTLPDNINAHLSEKLAATLKLI